MPLPNRPTAPDAGVGVIDTSDAPEVTTAHLLVGIDCVRGGWVVPGGSKSKKLLVLLRWSRSTPPPVITVDVPLPDATAPGRNAAVSARVAVAATSFDLAFMSLTALCPMASCVR